MGKTSFVWIAAIGLLSCKRQPTPDVVLDASAPTSHDVVTADASPPRPSKVVAMRSLASFRNDVLDECLDYALVSPDGGVELTVLEAKLDAMTKPPKEAVKLQTSCEEAFKDRTSLASCFVQKDAPADAGLTGVTFALLASYYSVRSLDDDVYMRDCLKAGGKWEAAKKNDREAARERLRQRAKALQDLAGKAAP